MQMGRLYYAGQRGIPREPERALEYFQQAAEQGLPEAEFNIGACCLQQRKLFVVNATFLYTRTMTFVQTGLGQTPQETVVVETGVSFGRGHGVAR
jgi:TPR repeat protein